MNVRLVRLRVFHRLDGRPVTLWKQVLGSTGLAGKPITHKLLKNVYAADILHRLGVLAEKPFRNENVQHHDTVLYLAASSDFELRGRVPAR